jgi:hypothetical protein
VINVRAAGPNRYVCDPVHASGRIGFGLDVIDPANEGSSRLGVYSLRASIRGEEIFQIKMNRFSYEDRENEIVSYYPFLIDQGCFLLQWRWPGNVCDIFNQTRADGWCEVPSEPAEVQIEAADFDGNKAAMVVPLQPEKRTEAPDSSHGAGTGTGTVEVSCVDTWLAVTAKFSAPEPQIPGLSVEGPVAAAGGFFHRVNATTFRAGVLPAREAEEITLRVKHDRIKPFDQRIYVFQRGSPDRTIAIDDAKITVKSNSPYGTLFLRGRTMEKASGCPVPQRGKALWLWPADLPIDVPISITLPAPGGIQDPRRAAVYRDAGSWWRLESETGKDPFTISTRHLGAFAVLEDTQPPSITNILAGNAAMRPTIRATVGDAGSGVADVAVTCNGHWLLAAYDPEKNVIAWEKDEDLPEGAKELKFTVTDKAGNSTTVMRAIEPGKEKAPTAKPKAAKPKATTSKSAAHKGAPQKVRTK